MSDKDSLFGSPPPSPARGRSPSLALPESSGWRLDAQTSSQNVGTIALPGSQKHSSELPVFLNPALPSENSVLQLRPPAQPAKAPRRRRRSTSHKAHSTFRLPSPSPHTTRTDRTLRDLVGLISHFEPVAPASSSRPPPIAVPFPRASQAPEIHPPGSAQNPIEIDALDTPGPADAVNSALIALAGTVASALKLPTTPQETLSLSKPTVNNVLHCIKHDPKLIPALQATYEYLGSIPNNSQPPPRSFSHVTTNEPDLSSTTTKKRKRKPSEPQVPAGAGHWDVPFPFAPGREPRGYSNWHLERGRRILGELLGLFERGFAKTRGSEIVSTTKPPSQRQPKTHLIRAVESVTGCEVEESTMGILHEGSIPSAAAAEDGGLDYQRMADWLSSVPPLPSSSSIMDSTNLAHMPSPSPSDLAPPSTNSLLDFMATLGPNLPDVLPSGADKKLDDFDYAGVFDELDAGIAEADMTWQAMVGSDPASQSINDIMALSIPELQSPTIYRTQESVPDPALTPSQQQGTQPSQSVSQTSQAVPTPSTLPMDIQDPAFLAAASGALASLMQSAAGSSRQHDPSVASGAGTEVDLGDTQSVDAHSLLTVPTASGSSSQRGSSTPYAQGSMSPAPSVNTALPASGKTKVERKVAVLARAREHREQLVKELERVQVQRWELLIEGGVLRNLEKADAQ